ncbi:MAG: hypothetical protein KF708_12525 [Pirellulales bacterium]|nr:hypothetical protein [Pirellulales bacterium]
MFRRIDKDGDGKISDEEREAARKAFHAHWQNRSKGNKGHGEAKTDDKNKEKKDGDKGGDQRRRRGPRAAADGPRPEGPPHRAGGPPRGSESGRARFMQRFDKDGDGKLSEEEGQAARQAFEEFRRRREDDKQNRPGDKGDQQEKGQDGDRREDS